MTERAALAGALALALLACDPAPSGPVWVIDEATPAPPIDDGHAAALLLEGLGPLGRARLTADFGEMATRLEARHHPLVIDLIGDDLAGDARTMVRRWLPARTAARVLARGRWTGPDHTVSVAAACPPGARCVPLGCPDRRLPIAAWPLVHARRLRLDDPDATSAAAEALRARIADETSRLALVLTAHPPSLPDPALLHRAARVLRRLPAGDRRLRRFAREAAAPDPAPRPPWWPAPGDLLIVPRLSALAEADAIDAEIAGALAHWPSTALPCPESRRD